MGTAIVTAVLLMLVLGLVLALVLVVAAMLMKVPSNEAAEAINDVLPGANCGACGYAGCMSYAAAVAAEGASTGLCIPGGDKVAAAVAEIMGQDVVDIAERKASVLCQGSYDKAALKYRYTGVASCTAQARMFLGSSNCPYGCLGYGDCVELCQFGAIHVENGVAIVDDSLCNGCGMCAKGCPKGLIEMVPLKNTAVVKCKNTDKGAVTRQICDIGCIGCGLCKKTCHFNAITLENNLATVDIEKCVYCKACIKKCPTGSIGSVFEIVAHSDSRLK